MTGNYNVAGSYNPLMNHTAPPSRSLPTLIVLIAALAAGLGLWLGNRQITEPPLLLTAGVLYPEPREVPDFQLMQANGQPYGKNDWLGHWNVLFFGYTSCPDVCPTTLAAFKQVLAELTKSGISSSFHFDFISVDPERDTPEKLGSYVAFFSPEFRAATGNEDDLNRLTHALGLIYTRTTGPDGAIQVDHSASAVIINPQGELVGLFRPPLTAAPIAADLSTLLKTHSNP